MPRLTAFALPVAAAAGVALGAGALVAAVARRTKPLHPEGLAGQGWLTVTPGEPSGVPFLDELGTHACTVRWSRAMGRGQGCSDIEGLAVRVAGADVLFASTGSGDVTRYLLAVRAPGVHGDLTTLLPVRSAAGPLVLRLHPECAGSPPRGYALAWSRARGPWRPAGTLELTWTDEDSTERFHPVGRPLPGTEQYAIVAALRAPAYLLARTVAARRRPLRG